MKFATLALVGAAKALDYVEAENYIKLADRNHNGCMEWSEAKTAATSYFSRVGKHLTTYQWGVIHNSWSEAAGSDKCMNDWELADWVNRVNPNFAAILTEFDAYRLPTAGLQITRSYEWSEQELTLPLTVSFDYKFDKAGEFIPIWGEHKQTWGNCYRTTDHCKSLTMYTSTNRHDFTFRTGVFKHFPTITRPNPGYNMVVGTEYHFEATITDTGAEYSINGKPYAKATYAAGTVPHKGRFGFAIYSGSEKKTVTDLKITQGGN